MIVSCWDILSQISPSHKTIDLLLLFDSYKYNHLKPKMFIRDSNKFVSIFESQKHLAKRNFNLSKNIFVWNLQFVFTMKNTKEMELEWEKAKISAHLFLSLNVEESKVYFFVIGASLTEIFIEDCLQKIFWKEYIGNISSIQPS